MQSENTSQTNVANLSARIGGILLAASKPLKIDEVAKTLNVSPDEIKERLPRIRTALTTVGMSISENAGKILLVTDPIVSSDVLKYTTNEQTRKLGSSTLETLTIILYSSPISKREIDHIRGVNSGYMLRNLMIRGLIEKTSALEGERSAIYQPTFDLLNHLGLEKREDLPQFNETVESLKEVLLRSDEGDNEKV